MALKGELAMVRTKPSVTKTNQPLIKTEPVKISIDNVCIPSAEEQTDENCKTKLNVLNNETKNVLIGTSVIKIEPVRIGIDNICNSSVKEEVDTDCKIKLKVLKNEAGNVPIISSIIKTEPVEIGIDDVWNSSDEYDIDTNFEREKKIFNHVTENVPINNTIETNEDYSRKPNEVEGGSTKHEDINVVNSLASDEQLVLNYSKNLGSIQNNTSNKSIGEDQINWATAYRTFDTYWENESRKIIRHVPPKITQRIAPHELTTLTRNKHVCNHCQYVSRDIKEVRRHIRSKHREEVSTYQCPYCPHKAKTYRRSLISHIISNHKDKKDIDWFECYLCNMKFKLKVRLSMHIKRVHFPVNDWQVCPICEKKYKNSKCLRHHIYSVHEKRKEHNHFCKECEFSCHGLTILRHHVEVCHTNSHQLPTYKCQQCKYQTKYKFLFQRHSKLHETRPSCEKCGFLASSRAYLKQHQMTHKKNIDESELKYRCTKCDYKTYKLSSFTAHKLNHLEPHEIQYFYCYHCDFKAKRKDNLKKHVLKHFEKDEVTFECFICDFLTKKRQLLITHVNKHSEAQNQDQVYS